MPNIPINFANLPKFKYGTTARINSTSDTPIINGSILIDTEASKIYTDQDGVRIHLNDIKTVDNYDSLPALPENKIYRLSDTGDLYWPKNVSGSLTWVNLCENNGSVTIDIALNLSSNNAIANSAVTAALNGKANSSHTHSQSDITGLTTAISAKASASDLSAVSARVSDLEANLGDMTKSVYDPDEDGIVERARTADEAVGIAWSGVYGKPSEIDNINGTIAAAVSSKMDTPSGGSVGQILTKTETGYEWADAQSSADHEYVYTVSNAGASSANGNYWLLDDDGDNSKVYTNGSWYLTEFQGYKTLASSRDADFIGSEYVYRENVTPAEWELGTGISPVPDVTEYNASQISVKPKLMITKPKYTANVYLLVQKSATPDGIYTTIIDTFNNADDYSKVKVFNGTTFETSSNAGIAPYYDNKSVLVDVESFMELGEYYRYQWFTSPNEVNNTDWYGGYYPSTNEQISNMADRLANAEAALNALGVTAISVVTELPSNPDVNTLYLIPES